MIDAINIDELYSKFKTKNDLLINLFRKRKLEEKAWKIMDIKVLNSEIKKPFNRINIYFYDKNQS